MDHRIAIPRLTADNEVETAEIATLAEYEQVTSAEDFALLIRLASRIRGKRIVFFNSTMQGGGVALMRHALIPLLRMLSVDAHWYVLFPKQEVFEVTKGKFHNVLQAVADPQVVLTSEDKEVYNAWIAENAEKFEPVFQQADVIVIDDPQPSGLIPYAKRANPRARIIYRSHIEIVASLANQAGTPQHTTWEFLWNYIKAADCYVSHPLREFIPDNIPEEKIVLMPATTDPLDGLNKPLTEEQMTYYLDMFNLFLFDDKQMALETDRPYIAQIARFDPSKGLPDAVESYRILRERLNDSNAVYPQLVLAGNSATDDPDGLHVYTAIREILQTERYADLAHDVKLGRLPHLDELLNTLLRKCVVAMQLSVREGFEVKVTEALMKGKPVVAYRSGGIPLQIQDGIDGFLVDTGNTSRVADVLYDLLTNRDTYQHMSSAAASLYNKDFLTVSNAVCWLYLADTLLEHGKIEGHYQYVKALARLHFAD